MHFIFLTLGYHPDRVGGAYRYLTAVAERLAERDHVVQVIYPKPVAGRGESEVRNGVHLHGFPNRTGHPVTNWIQENGWARQTCRSLRPASAQPCLTVFAHAFFGPCFNRRWAPSVFLFTGPWAEEYRLAQSGRPGSWWRKWLDGCFQLVMRRVERRLLQKVQRILTLSQYYRTQLPRWHGNRLAPVTVLGGGVDFDRFQPAADRRAIRASWGLTEQDYLWLAVRRLDPRMGLGVLLEGFAAVARDHPRAQLWIAGDGPQRGELESRRTQLGLDQRVRLLGWVPEERLPGLLAAADCGIMPSLDLEGFGLATAEALACGTPVLGSRAGATPELLEPLDAGLLFEAGSPTALAAKLRAVLEGRLALPSPARCVAYAREHFSWEQPVTALELAFRDLCLARGPS